MPYQYSLRHRQPGRFTPCVASCLVLRAFYFFKRGVLLVSSGGPALILTCVARIREMYIVTSSFQFARNGGIGLASLFSPFCAAKSPIHGLDKSQAAGEQASLQTRWSHLCSVFLALRSSTSWVGRSPRLHRSVPTSSPAR